MAQKYSKKQSAGTCLGQENEPIEGKKVSLLSDILGRFYALKRHALVKLVEFTLETCLPLR